MSDSQVGPAARMSLRPGPRKDRVVLQLGPDRSLTITGAETTLDAIIELLEDVLGRARKARQMKMGLKTFVSMLKDQLEA